MVSTGNFHHRSSSRLVFIPLIFFSRFFLRWTVGQMIKVKDFAKCKDIENRVAVQPVEDVISLSSGDDEKEPLHPETPTTTKASKAPKTSKQPKSPKEPKTPKPKPRTLSALSRKHISRTPLAFPNHKIFEYFQSAKKDCKSLFLCRHRVVPLSTFIWLNWPLYRYNRAKETIRKRCHRGKRWTQWKRDTSLEETITKC